MKNFLRRDRGRGILDYAVIFLGLALVFWAGCSIDQMPGPEIDQQEEIILSRDNVQVQIVMEIQERATDDLLSKPGVVGTATGMTEDGRPAIVIMVESETVSKAVALPDEIEAVPVIVMVTGVIKAIKGPPGGGGGVDHEARFDRPVPIGISTGHPAITAGTIGARLIANTGAYYALSNNHVYADQNAATIGDDVIQPGTFDGGSSPADDLGTLAAFVEIVFGGGANTVDAAVASTTMDDLGNATTSDCYGTPNSTTTTASVNMRVEKCGRTTESTKGRISAINASVNVGYDAGVALFTGQLVVSGGNFSAGGDSGSLVVVQKGGDKGNPVGLLFAGSSTSTIINPIGPVLTLLATELGVSTLTIDGN